MPEGVVHVSQRVAVVGDVHFLVFYVQLLLLVLLQGVASPHLSSYPVLLVVENGEDKNVEQEQGTTYSHGYPEAETVTASGGQLIGDEVVTVLKVRHVLVIGWWIRCQNGRHRFRDVVFRLHTLLVLRGEGEVTFRKALEVLARYSWRRWHLELSDRLFAEVRLEVWRFRGLRFDRVYCRSLIDVGQLLWRLPPAIRSLCVIYSEIIARIEKENVFWRDSILQVSHAVRREFESEKHSLTFLAMLEGRKETRYKIRVKDRLMDGDSVRCEPRASGEMHRTNSHKRQEEGERWASCSASQVVRCRNNFTFPGWSLFEIEIHAESYFVFIDLQYSNFIQFFFFYKFILLIKNCPPNLNIIYFHLFVYEILLNFQ